MRARSIVLAVALASSPGGLSQLMAAAAPPTPVVFNLRPTAFCCPEAGTWEASGDVSDSGTFERTFIQAAPPNAPPFALVPFREVFLLQGTGGTLTIKDESRNTEVGVTGVWQIISGTGVYEGSSGHGTLAFDLPTLTLTLTGVYQTVGPPT